MNKQFNEQEVKDAYMRIRNYVYKTPLEESLYLGANGREYYFKLESSQSVKSFKIRGALNKMLTLNQEEKERGVATISSGNHGASVSYASKLLGIKNAVVIVPENTPKAKIQKIQHYGAKVMSLGKNYDEANRLGMNFVKEKNMVYIDPYYDDPKIYGGQGTIGLEILEQNPDIDTIVVPIGGGGLITGIAVAAKSVKPEIRIIGVQTAACPAMIKSFKENIFYKEYPNKPSVCDALIGGVGKLAYEILKDYVDELIEVEEESIEKATSFMIKKEKFIVEPASAICISAVLDHRERVGGQKIAMVMSGGNIDEDLIVKLINKY